MINKINSVRFGSPTTSFAPYFMLLVIGCVHMTSPIRVPLGCGYRTHKVSEFGIFRDSRVPNNLLQVFVAKHQNKGWEVTFQRKDYGGLPWGEKREDNWPCEKQKTKEGQTSTSSGVHERVISEETEFVSFPGTECHRTFFFFIFEISKSWEKTNYS